jgi:hypothetical protein
MELASDEPLMSRLPEDLDEALAQVEDADDVAALKQARKEATEVDLADRVDYKGQTITTTNGNTINNRSMSTVVTSTQQSSNVTSPALSNIDQYENERDEEPGDIEEYMLRQAEWNYKLLDQAPE